MEENNNNIPNITKSHIYQLQKAMRQNKLVIFVGAGVSKSCHVPLWPELIQELSRELDLPDSEKDFLKIPQIYKNLRKDKEYFERVKDILLYGQVTSNEIHDALLDMNPCHVVTTNYDDLLEQAIIKRNGNFFTVSRDEDLPYNQGERLLIKMHGDFKSGKIVLTENDYFDYAKNYPLIRSYIMSLFASKLVLFVGFSYSDINLKYIIRDVRNCLGEKMQPIYMLSNEEKNSHVLNYFDSNYIHLIQLNLEEVEKTLAEQRIEFKEKIFDDNRSTLLYKQLVLITHYNENNNDFFSLFVNYLSDNIDQFLYLGKYIRYVFPRKYQRSVFFTFGILTLPDVYIESAKLVFGESEEAIIFREVHKDDFEKLLAWLNTNGVYSIKGVADLTPFYEQLSDNQSEDIHPLMYLRNLDIKNVSKCLEEYSNRPLTYSKEDLLYPYLLCKCGRYKEAYDCYKRLSFSMTSNKKYVLAFICKYNMRSLYSPVLNEINTRDWDMWKRLNEEMSNIDVVDVLNNMPISGLMRTVLFDLANGKYLSDRVATSADLCQKLKDQRDSSEKGGSSINSNVKSVLVNAYDLIDFDSCNYIFSEPFGHYKRINQNSVESVLHSILTFEGEWKPSKLESLSSLTTDLFILHVDSSDLGKLLKKVVGTNRLPVDDSFKQQLKQWLDNIYEASDNGLNRQTCISRKRIAEILLNMLWISLYTEEDLELPHINDLIAEYWFDGAMMTHDKLFNQFFSRYKPTPESSIRHLENILHSNIAYSEHLDDAVCCLCNYVAEGNKSLDELISVKIIQQASNIKYKASFCKVAADDVRIEIISHLRNSVVSMYQLVEAEIYSGGMIITPELLHKLKDRMATKRDRDLYPEAFVCANLNLMLANTKYESLRTTVEGILKNNRCYQFFKNPVMYDGLISETEGNWYMFVNDYDLKMLLVNPLVRQIVRKFCDENPWAETFKSKVWNMI